MSTFYIESLGDSPISTNIRLDSNIRIENIRAHIFRDGFLTEGQLEVSLCEGTEVLNTTEIDYTELNNISDKEYIHGWVRFDIPTSLKWKFHTDYSEYTIKIRYKNGSGPIYLVSDLNSPIVETHDTKSIYARGFELFTRRQI